MDKLQPTLENSKVILKPLQENNAELLWPIAQEEALWIYGITDLTIREEFDKYIKSALLDRANGITAVWIIIDAKTGKAAGCTRLAEISWRDERGQIGWTWLGKDFQGTGLNAAAKYEILKYGFETLGLNRIELKADERNIQSRKAMEKIGAKYEGTLRQHLKIRDGYIRNSVFYSILKSEWAEVKKNLETKYLNL